MKKRSETLDEFGRLFARIGLTLHCWWQLFWLQRELGALEHRRDDYLLKLGRKVYGVMKAAGPDTIPEAHDLFMDVRAVQSRIEQINRAREEARRLPLAAAESSRLPPLPSLEGLPLPGAGQGGQPCSCGAVVPPGARFCMACGRSTQAAAAPEPARPTRRAPGKEPRRTCPSCGGFVPLMTDYCPHCQSPAISYRLDED